jgi:hypothetical protein
MRLHCYCTITDDRPLESPRIEGKHQRKQQVIMGDYPLVLIEWEDSSQPASRWYALNELKSETSAICQTVGFLVDDGSVKIVASSIGSYRQASHATGLICIPSRSVIEVRRLHDESDLVNLD